MLLLLLCTIFTSISAYQPFRPHLLSKHQQSSLETRNCYLKRRKTSFAFPPPIAPSLSLSSRCSLALHAAKRNDDSIHERNAERTSVKNLLTQRAVQSFMFLLEDMRDPHTVNWLEELSGTKNMLQYHGTAAFNTTNFPGWDGFLITMMKRPADVVKFTRKRSRGMGGASGIGGWSVGGTDTLGQRRRENPYLKDHYVEFQVDINPPSLASRILSVREQIANEWKSDLDVVIRAGDDLLHSYIENVIKERDDEEIGDGEVPEYKAANKIVENDTDNESSDNDIDNQNNNKENIMSEGETDVAIKDPPEEKYYEEEKELEIEEGPGVIFSKDQIASESASLNEGTSRVDESRDMESEARTAYLDWCKEYGKTVSEEKFPIFKKNYIAMAEFAEKTKRPIMLNMYADCTEGQYSAMTSGDQKPKLAAMKNMRGDKKKGFGAGNIMKIGDDLTGNDNQRKNKNKRGEYGRPSQKQVGFLTGGSGEGTKRGDVTGRKNKRRGQYEKSSRHDAGLVTGKTTGGVAARGNSAGGVPNKSGPSELKNKDDTAGDIQIENKTNDKVNQEAVGETTLTSGAKFGGPSDSGKGEDEITGIRQDTVMRGIKSEGGIRDTEEVKGPSEIDKDGGKTDVASKKSADISSPYNDQSADTPVTPPSQSTEEKPATFDRNAMFFLRQTIAFDEFQPSPLRQGNFDLLMLLATQESVHRVLRELRDSGSDDILYKWLRDFYVERTASFFDGNQKVGRADDFLEELILTPPSVVKGGGKGVSLIDPLGVVEKIVRERGRVASEWKDVMAEVPTDHLRIRGMLFSQQMQNSSEDEELQQNTDVQQEKGFE